jgi:hypothetical protein
MDEVYKSDDKYDKVDRCDPTSAASLVIQRGHVSCKDVVPIVDRPADGRELQ